MGEAFEPAPRPLPAAMPAAELGAAPPPRARVTLGEPTFEQPRTGQIMPPLRDPNALTGLAGLETRGISPPGPLTPVDVQRIPYQYEPPAMTESEASVLEGGYRGPSMRPLLLPATIPAGWLGGLAGGALGALLPFPGGAALGATLGAGAAAGGLGAFAMAPEGMRPGELAGETAMGALTGGGLGALGGALTRGVMGRMAQTQALRGAAAGPAGLPRVPPQAGPPLRGPPGQFPLSQPPQQLSPGAFQGPAPAAPWGQMRLGPGAIAPPQPPTPLGLPAPAIPRVPRQLPAQTVTSGTIRNFPPR